MNIAIMRGIVDQHTIHIRIWDTELSEDKDQMFSLNVNDDEFDDLVLALANFMDYEPIRGITETA